MSFVWLVYLSINAHACRIFPPESWLVWAYSDKHNFLTTLVSLYFARRSVSFLPTWQWRQTSWKRVGGQHCFLDLRASSNYRATRVSNRCFLIFWRSESRAWGKIGQLCDRDGSKRLCEHSRQLLVSSGDRQLQSHNDPGGRIGSKPGQGVCRLGELSSLVCFLDSYCVSPSSQVNNVLVNDSFLSQVVYFVSYHWLSL